MRRATLAFTGIISAGLLAGCGTASLTVKVPSPSASVVVSSDSDAIAALKSRVQQIFAGGGSAGASVVDGDQHSGNRVCGFSKDKNGHTYQVDVYGNAPAETCNAEAQQTFFNNIP